MPSMSEFIHDHIEPILIEWEKFAGTLLPAAKGLGPEALRDSAREILVTICEEMSTRQSDAEQAEKSRGNRPGHAPDVTNSAKEHAKDRLDAGFSLDQLVAEYRALRASVIRLWTVHVMVAREAELDQLIRFNEALDQSQSEAISWYSRCLDDAHDIFAGVLAHDLRNPLGAMLTSAEALLQSNDPQTENARAAAHIRRSGKRIAEMIRDLLDFTRTRLGDGLPMSPKPADLAQICRSTIEELEAFHPTCRLRFEPSGDLSGHWDAARLEQALSNLIGNAIRHGQRGAPITISAQGMADTVHVSVHNVGPAIPADRRRALFHPHVRAAIHEHVGDSKSGELGLGLYIAQQVAEAHGGSIDVTSSEVSGTTFTLRLPRERETAAADRKR